GRASSFGADSLCVMTPARPILLGNTSIVVYHLSSILFSVFGTGGFGARTGRIVIPSTLCSTGATRLIASYALRGTVARSNPRCYHLLVVNRSCTATAGRSSEQCQCRTPASTSDKRKKIAKTSSVRRRRGASNAATTARIARPANRASTRPSLTSYPV